MLATRVSQKESVFYFAAWPAADRAALRLDDLVGLPDALASLVPGPD